ncbi:polysaccharide deacetylase family protein [Embleya sp. NBC_00896]|uniref:polysaccharide deacetylase family protein n=1 Tax=Embleya sp. NBC_00896 TaxID=2975961 RepID=UPI00386C5752|nr:polysaccharide deacetylase family protein [Embleya sp. NBC_00896]
MTAISGDRVRATLKRGLAATALARDPAPGATLLIYHRVGGGSNDELDLPAAAFRDQLDLLPREHVVSLDVAVDRLAAGEKTPSIVLTFDDGFADVYANAWPELRRRALPFTLYLATGCIGAEMRWEGSTGTSAGSPALTWGQITEMAESGLATIGNHTRSHARPEVLTATELDDASDDIESRLGIRPAHFAYTWGIAVPDMEHALRCRFRSAATGVLGRNLPGCDPIRLRRVPVRRTDPPAFFRAKLGGRLAQERAYAAVVSLGKKAGAHA